MMFYWVKNKKFVLVSKKNIKVLVLFAMCLFILLHYDMLYLLCGKICEEQMRFEYCDSISEIPQDIQTSGKENEITDTINNAQHTQGNITESKKLLLHKMYNNCRRRFQWYFREQYKDKYDSYKEFKESWNPEIKFRDEIKKEINNKIDRIKLHKRTLDWFLGRRKASRYGNRRNDR